MQAAEEYGLFDIVFEAAGASSVAFKSMRALGRNGVLVLTGYGEEATEDRGAGDRIMLRFVLAYKVFVEVGSGMPR